MFTIKNLIDFLGEIKDKEFLISGHSLPKELNKAADLITFFKSEKVLLR